MGLAVKPPALVAAAVEPRLRQALAVKRPVAIPLGAMDQERTVERVETLLVVVAVAATLVVAVEVGAAAVAAAPVTVQMVRPIQLPRMRLRSR
jgi:hypothetical protein